MASISVPVAELFTIRLHYNCGGMERMVGHVDYCCADQILRIELFAMAREFNLNVNECSVWWVNSGVDELREIHNDMDVLNMAINVDYRREICVHFRTSNCDTGQVVSIPRNVVEVDDEDEECLETDEDLEDILVGGRTRKDLMRTSISMTLIIVSAMTQMRKGRTLGQTIDP